MVRWVEASEKVKLKFLQGKWTAFTFPYLRPHEEQLLFFLSWVLLLRTLPVFASWVFLTFSVVLLHDRTGGNGRRRTLLAFCWDLWCSLILLVGTPTVRYVNWVDSEHQNVRALQESILLLLSTPPVGNCAGSSGCNKDQNNSPLWGALSLSSEMTPLFLWSPGCVISWVSTWTWY